MMCHNYEIPLKDCLAYSLKTVWAKGKLSIADVRGDVIETFSGIFMPVIILNVIFGVILLNSIMLSVLLQCVILKSVILQSVIVQSVIWI